jgi:hypothetical protein
MIGALSGNTFPPVSHAPHFQEARGPLIFDFPMYPRSELCGRSDAACTFCPDRAMMTINHSEKARTIDFWTWDQKADFIVIRLKSGCK